MTERLRVGVAGVHGHGRGHVDAVLGAADLELVAVADPRGGGDVPSSTRAFTDAVAMIDAVDLDVVVLSTPIPTHAGLARLALARGAHVLLEKPPVASVADHHALVRATDAASRAVQVGFQSLGSAGVAATADAAASGVIGEVLHHGAVGLWSRSEEYWRRAPWAGHRVIDGRPVADGVATNPLAHALATAFAIAGAAAPEDVVGIDADLRRANDIATDDTSSLVVGLRGGARVAAGLAVTAATRHEPYVLVRGTRGFLVYVYTLDTLHVHRDGAALPRTYAFERTGLIDNLVRHVRDGDALLAPLGRTGAFTRVLEEIVTGPPATPIAPQLVRIEASAGETFRTVIGVEEAVERVAWEARTFRDLDLL
ncbi:putative dehydrogenase [Microbacterium trichothecenolyticum]|uniref:Gfo/Idh/MocA family protein n=1 Tax=Microbacterium trichothecenolyticum TaxID=69370 RepID=UPI00285D9BE7|nr:Gfo/Idh/MocA family oxidoreductase [Microbacterium trichothecenolyticum]MDR7183161.1 putative dehydrogenase [Microbacterium trichothecenolyticum]